jgi:hypothetical protein
MSWIYRFAIGLSLVLTLPVAQAEPTAPIAEWIDQLGADQFSRREAASRSLAEAGRDALGPLGEAIQRDDLEVASRAVEVVRGFLEGDDADLAAEAEKLLESIADGPQTPVAAMAIATLDFHHLGMAEVAREKLESLGAVITEGFLPSGRRGLHVVLNARWHGAAEDLRLLSRLRGVLQVGLYGVPLDAQAVAALGRLRGVESVQLFGTGVADEQLAALTAKLPEARIDVRKGGKLGVGGQPMIGPCLITQVQENSAAAKAGIQIGDIVVRINGEPVANFEALTDKVGRHGPGDKIELAIERAVPGAKAERFTRTVELDGWE